MINTLIHSVAINIGNIICVTITPIVIKTFGIQFINDHNNGKKSIIIYKEEKLQI